MSYLMELPFNKSHLRKTLLVLWFPSIAVTFFAAGSLILAKDNPPQDLLSLDTTSAQSASLYAAAPLRGAVLGDSIIADTDTRVAIVRSYLQSKNSPMVNSAGTFITVADRYDLDWRLLIAISGNESNFGKRIPSGSHNAWGWGIPTGAQSGLAFANWDNAIETVGRGLRTNYFNKGYTTLRQIESKYTPPSAANPNHPWVAGVSHFMAELEGHRL